MQGLIFLAGFVMFVFLGALVMWLIFQLDDADKLMSKTWLKEQARLEVRTVAALEHQLVIDGEVAVASPDERVVLAVRREIESLR